MQTGWILKPEGWYYANTSGAVVNGWQLVNKRWYYLNPQKEGLMSTGWIKLGDIWYYLEAVERLKPAGGIIIISEVTEQCVQAGS